MARTRVHPRQARTFVIGLVAALIIGGVLYYALDAKSLGGLPGTSHTFVRADFADVGTLEPGAPVRQDSVQIGQVSSIVYANGQAVVTLQLDGDRPVYGNAQVSVWDQSALATKFVELDPGTPSGGPVRNGTIAVSHTSSSQSLDQLFDVFDPAARAGLAGAVRQLGTGVAGHGPDINALAGAGPKLVPEVQTVAGVLAAPQTDLPGLVQNANGLAGRFTGMQQQIALLLQQANTTLAAVDVDGGAPLRNSISELPATLQAARTALNQLNQPLADTQAALTTLRPGAQALGNSSQDLQGFLNGAVVPLRKVPGVAQQATPAVDSLTTTFADARPLVPQLTQALSDLVPPLEILAPYSPEIAQLFAQKNMLAMHDGDNHALRIGLAFPYPQAQAVLGELLATLPRDPYPAPGQARNDGSTGLLSTGGGR